MVDFNDPNAFSDPEDAAIVVDAKKTIGELVEYVFTEVFNNSSLKSSV